MCRKLFLLVLVLGLASTALAGPTWVGTVSRAWGTGGNWSLGAVPGTADTPAVTWANTASVPFTPLISTENAVGDKFNLAYSNASGYLEMTGGSLTIGSLGVYIGNSSGSDSVVMDMSGGLFKVTGADWRVGRRSGANFNMTGGTLDIVKFKPGARTHDTAYALKTTVIDLVDGLVLADSSGIERSKIIVRDAVMVFDSTAGVDAASDIDADIDNALAMGWFRPWGVLNGSVINGVTYSIVKSWNAFGDILTVTAVPEPATIALLGLGGLALLRRKR